MNLVDRWSRMRRDARLAWTAYVILAILLPPLAVYLKTNNVKTTLLNVVLCFLFWIPAVIHALYVVLKK